MGHFYQAHPGDCRDGVLQKSADSAPAPRGRSRRPRSKSAPARDSAGEGLSTGQTSRPQHSPIDWAKAIAAQARRGTKGTLDLGRLVYAARRALPYGGWSKLWRSVRVPFSKRHGEKLCRIGEVLGPLDAHVCAQLPYGRSSLHQLARLDRSTVEDLVRRQVIHRRLKAKQVSALVAKILGQSKSPSRRLNLKQRLERLKTFVDETLADWTAKHRDLSTTELSRLIRKIQGRSVVAPVEAPEPIICFPSNVPNSPAPRRDSEKKHRINHG